MVKIKQSIIFIRQTSAIQNTIHNKFVILKSLLPYFHQIVFDLAIGN